MLTSPDRGWSWIVLLSVFGVNAAIGCVIRVVGVMQISLLNRFSDTNVKTSFVGSIFTFLTSAGGVAASLAIPKLGCRLTTMIGSVMATVGSVTSVFVNSVDWLIITYGLLSGMGLGIAYTASMVALAFNFERHQNLACGIAVAGHGLGALVYPIILDFIVDKYGDMAIFLVNGAVMLHIVLFGSTLFPSQIENEYLEAIKARTLKTRRNSLQHERLQCLYICKHVRFLFVLICLCFANTGISICFAYLPSFSINKGNTSTQASYLVSVTGGLMLTFRFLSGLAANTENIDERLIYLGSFGCLGFATMFLPLYGQQWSGQMTYSAFLGMYFGNIYSVLNSVNTQLVGLKNIDLAYGYEMFAIGIGELIGPPLAGLILDADGQYEECFYVAGALILLATLFGFGSELFPQYQAQFDTSVIGNTKEKDVQKQSDLDSREFNSKRIVSQEPEVSIIHVCEIHLAQTSSDNRISYYSYYENMY